MGLVIGNILMSWFTRQPEESAPVETPFSVPENPQAMYGARVWYKQAQTLNIVTTGVIVDVKETRCGVVWVLISPDDDARFCAKWHIAADAIQSYIWAVR